jgi:integrase/recombinase XerD
MNKKPISMEIHNNTSCDDLFNMYIKNCEVRNLSEYTIDNYKRKYDLFKRFTDTEKLKLSELNQDLFDDFILWLRKNTGQKQVSIKSTMKSLKPIFRYGMKKGLVENFEFSKIRVEYKVKKIYTDTEVERLIEKPNIKECDFSYYRNWVVVCFLLATGVRRLELCNIKIGDVSFNSGVVLLTRTKTNKPRYIPISSTLIEILRDYLIYRKGDEDDYLFPNIYGEQWHEKTMSNEIAKFNASRGVKKSSVHLFRHTFGSRYIENGGNPLKLQRILGHSSMRMVNHYVHLDTESLRSDIDAYNPLEKFSKTKKTKIKL